MFTLKGKEKHLQEQDVAADCQKQEMKTQFTNRCQRKGFWESVCQISTHTRRTVLSKSLHLRLCLLASITKHLLFVISQETNKKVYLYSRRKQNRFSSFMILQQRGYIHYYKSQTLPVCQDAASLPSPFYRFMWDAMH